MFWDSTLQGAWGNPSPLVLSFAELVLAQGKLIMEDVSGCFSTPLGCILSGKCCLSYEAGIPISKFGSMYLMNYFYAHFPFPCTAMLTVWFADIYENGKEKTWSSSLTRPHIYHIAEKTRKKGFGGCLSNG